MRICHHQKGVRPAILRFSFLVGAITFGFAYFGEGDVVDGVVFPGVAVDLH